MNKKKKKEIILFIVLVVLLLASVSVTVWALFFRTSEVTLTPDYAPRQKEVHAEKLDDGNDKKLEQAEGGGAVSLTYTTQVIVSLSEETANIYFGNPTKSNQDMVIQIVVHDEIIAQSGTIVPGKKVETLDLLDGAVQMLSEGGYDGEIIVLYYQEDTHEKTIVNTEIPVNIIVEP